MEYKLNRIKKAVEKALAAKEVRIVEGPRYGKEVVRFNVGGEEFQAYNKNKGLEVVIVRDSLHVRDSFSKYAKARIREAYKPSSEPQVLDTDDLEGAERLADAHERILNEMVQDGHLEKWEYVLLYEGIPREENEVRVKVYLAKPLDSTIYFPTRWINWFTWAYNRGKDT